MGRVSPSTISRWERLRRERGATALDPAYSGRSARSYGSHWDRHPEQAELALALFYEHGPSVQAAFVAEQVRERFPEEAERGEVPSVRAVQRFRQAFRRREPQLCDYLEDPDAWKGKHLTAVGSMSEGVRRLNEVWEVDSTRGDVLLQDTRPDGSVRLKRHALCSPWSRSTAAWRACSSCPRRRRGRRCSSCGGRSSSGGAILSACGWTSGRPTGAGPTPAR